MRNGPDYIQFYPTTRCNRDCGFCFNKEIPFMDDMPLENFCRMRDTLQSIGVKSIDIMGGEPTLHGQLLAMLRQAEESRFDVNLSSNGTDVAMLTRILDSNRNIVLGISINDRSTLEQLKPFIKKRGPVVKSLFPVHRDFQLTEAILAAGPGEFYILYPDAIKKRDLLNSLPFPEFITECRKKFEPRYVGTVFCSGFLPDAGTYPELSQVRCPAGTTKLGIMPDGSVYPCNLFFGNPDLCLGNILVDPFNTIWNNPVLDFFRTFAGNACPQGFCPLHKECHGGCPAHGLLHFGSLSAPEPRCVTA